MDKIPTAEEVLNRDYTSTKENAIKAMIEFAKMHVKLALTQASEDGKISDNSKYMTREELEYGAVKKYHIDKSSILNAYPLTEIK